MKTTTIFGIMAVIMLAISTEAKAYMHSLNASSVVIGTTTIDSLFFNWGGLDSATQLPASFKIRYSNSPISNGNYSTGSQITINDTGGTVAISLSGLVSGDTVFINYVFQSYGSAFFIANSTVGDVKIITLGPPTILLSLVTNTPINFGQNATLVTSAASNSNPDSVSYQWYEGSTATTVTTVISGEVDSFITVSPSADNFYKCIVTNLLSLTATTNVAKVTVTIPPSITGQPQSVWVNPGSTGTLSLGSVSGTSPFTYKWIDANTGSQKGAASSYSKAVSAPSDSITLYCVVSNGAGSDTSIMATIYVNVLPATLGTISSSNITTTSAKINGSGDGNGLPTTVWVLYKPATSATFIDSISVSVNSGPFTFSQMLTELNGCETYIYQVKVDNGIGTPPSSALQNLTTGSLPPEATLNDPQMSSSTALIDGLWNSFCNSFSYLALYEKGTTPNNLTAVGTWMSAGNGGSGTLQNTLTGLSPNTTYYFRVKLKDPNGVITPSNVISGTTAPQPPTSTINFWSVQFPGGVTGKVEIKAKTSDLAGMDIVARYDTSTSIGVTSLMSNSVTVYGNTLTSYYFDLPSVIPGHTHYIEFVFVHNSVGIQDTTAQFNFFVPIPLDVEEVNFDEMVKVYPNPIKSGTMLTVETLEAGNILIMDILGQTVQEERVLKGPNPIELKLPPGLYFYQCGRKTAKLVVK